MTLLPRSVSARLGLVLVVLLLALGVAFTALTQWLLERHRLEVSQALHSGLASSLVKEYAVFDDNGVSAVGLEGIFHTLMAVNPAIEVYLLDSDGRILQYSAPYRAVEMSTVELEPVRAFLGGARGYQVVGDNPRAPGQKNVFSAAPVTVNGDLMGYLYVVLGGDLYASINAEVGADTARMLSLAATAGILGFALVVGLIVFRLFTVRLRRLDASMRKFAGDCESDDCAPIPSPRKRDGDELDRLTARFADLTARVTEQVQTIRRSDRLRRQLVANVSHDFRTPLAALDGYLQTLLMKEDQLSAKEKREYVQIAAKSGQRLTRLVQELFELSRLEAKDRAAVPEAFCMRELVNDVMAKFQLHAAEKPLQLELQADASAPHVYAEIGLIERVLENLIGNAMDHTPANGFVRVSVASADEGSVEIAVHDSGTGISKRELPHIFERFYRADAASDRSTQGSGLGLAIVKRILELHRSRIVAKSEKGRGSSFVFWLPEAAKAG